MKNATLRTAARVIVIGGGLAGQTAAITAADCGAKVILLEKEARLGGNSAKATSGINGWGTRAQANQGVMDGGKYFERDTYRSGVGGTCDTGLVKTLSIKSADAIRWLTSLGVPLTELTQLGGASRKRCHRIPDKADGTPVPVGFTIVRTLEQHIRTKLADSVQVETSARLVELLKEVRTLPSGLNATVVTGVAYEQEGEPVTTDGSSAAAANHVRRVEISADAVILATGGFSNDHTQHSLLSEFAPHLAAFPTTNGVWATGDGVKLARDVGAELTDMDKVQLHPTGLLDPKDPANRTKYLGPEALRGSGGILLNKHGDRFVDELNLRSVVSNAIIEQDNVFPESGGSRFAYCVLNDAAVKLFGVNALGFYWKKLGLFTKVDNVGALAKLIGCDAAHLQHTLEQYAQTSSGKSSCLQTGKSVFPCVLGPDGPFFVAYVTPSIHYTMGGCHISPSAELLSSIASSPFMNHSSILGLFGAGEVTGGVHGGNRLGGNSLLECVVFGKIAGDRAAHITAAQDNPEALAAGRWTTAAVREVHAQDGPAEDTAESGRQVTLRLPSVLQRSGLRLLQRVRVCPAEARTGEPVVLLPSSSANALGAVAVYLPPRRDSNAAMKWLYDLAPDTEVRLQPEEASVASAAEVITQHTKELYVIATAPRGVAAVLQLLQSGFEEPMRSRLMHLRLLYGARNIAELSYHKMLETCGAAQSKLKGRLDCTILLDDPPEKWTGGVGVVDEEALRGFLPAAPARTSDQTEPPSVTIVVAADADVEKQATNYLQSNGYAGNVNIIVLP